MLHSHAKQTTKQAKSTVSIATVHTLQAGGDSGKYQSSDFAAALATQPNEYNYWITEIEGEVPLHLRGTLFRNGPGR